MRIVVSTAVAVASLSCGHTIAYELLPDDLPRSPTRTSLQIAVVPFQFLAELPEHTTVSEGGVQWRTNSVRGYRGDLGTAVAEQVARHLQRTDYFRTVTCCDGGEKADLVLAGTVGRYEAFVQQGPIPDIPGETGEAVLHGPLAVALTRIFAGRRRTPDDARWVAAQVDLVGITLTRRTTQKELWSGESMGSVVRAVPSQEVDRSDAAHQWADQALKSAVNRMVARVAAASVMVR